MPANYVLLNKVTLGASVSSVTFANIPQSGYTDLKIALSVRTSVADTYQSGGMFINSVAADNSYRSLRGNGSTVTSGNSSAQNEWYCGEWNGNTSTVNTFTSSEIYIPNYLSSNQKSFSADTVQEANTTTAIAMMLTGVCTKTAAINSITFRTFGGGINNLVSGSTFYLYGLAAVGATPVIAPFASGGDVITNDGTYWYHAFLSSGTFTPAKTMSCSVLTTAGGGGGGGRAGGGGGAGGVAYQASRSVTASTALTVTVGAGGAGAAASSGAATDGASGSNTVFDTITANGGGAGSATAGGTAGGSGGGGSPGVAGGAATQGSSGGATGYGFAGGAGAYGVSLWTYVGGGGGGAGVAGTTATSGSAGPGGNGLNTWSAWLSATSLGVSGYIAGGGGGGKAGDSTNPTASPSAGGTGGGGTGGVNFTGKTSYALAGSATVNTGSGGGGGGAYDSPNYWNTTGGGNGGSGIVIVRYLMA